MLVVALPTLPSAHWSIIYDFVLRKKVLCLLWAVGFNQWTGHHLYLSTATLITKHRILPPNPQIKIKRSSFSSLHFAASDLVSGEGSGNISSRATLIHSGSYCSSCVSGPIVVDVRVSSVPDSEFMEKNTEPAANVSSASSGIGSRYFDLKKSFKFAMRSLLTACSKEEFDKAFLRFTTAEKEWLHRQYLQVITSLHENIEAEFESICLETQVGATLDAVEEMVEERELDPFFSNKSNVMDVVEDLSTAKKNEIQQLMRMIQLGEEHNNRLRRQVQLLREGKQAMSGASDAIEKFRNRNLTYGAN